MFISNIRISFNLFINRDEKATTIITEHFNWIEWKKNYKL